MYLASDRAKDVTGRLFKVRNNEIFLMNQIRPVRSVRNGTGWSPEDTEEHAIMALRDNSHPLEVAADVFAWDPI